MNKSKVLFIFLIVVAAIDLIGQSTLKIGEQAPEILIEKWIQNEPQNKSLKDKYIILDFWATWCKPCLENVPHINELYEKYSGNDILFLHMTNESKSTAEKVFDRVDFKTSVVTDKSNQTHINFGDGMNGLSYYPMAVLIDDQNIVRWYGSSEKLSEEMIDNLLNNKNISVSQMSEDSPLAKVNDAEYYINQPFSLKLWSDMFHDPSIEFSSYIAPHDTTSTEKTISAVTGNGAILMKSTLKEIFKSLYADKEVIIPADISEIEYDFYFVDKNLNSDSYDILVSSIGDQLGLSMEKSKANGVNIELQVKDKQKLSPPIKGNRNSIKNKEDRTMVLYRNTIEELARALSIRTDYFWSYNGKDQKRYSFQIELSSYETIISALKEIGITTKERDMTRDIYILSKL